MGKLKDHYIEKPDYVDTRIDNTKNNPYTLEDKSNGTPFTDEQWKNWFSNHKSSDEDTHEEHDEKREEEEDSRLEEANDRELDDIAERLGE